MYLALSDTVELNVLVKTIASVDNRVWLITREVR